MGRHLMEQATSRFNVGPWTAGIVNAVRSTEIPPAGLSDAVNVDIDRSGHITPRKTFELVDPSHAHSLFEHDGTTYGVVGGDLGELSDAGFRAMAPVSGRVAWAVINAEPVFVTREALFRVVDGQVEPYPAGESLDAEREMMLRPMPGGQWVGYWQGRSVVARGNSLIFSDPLRYGAYDPLRNFIQFEKRVHWFAPLETGVFVGLTDSVRFLRGADYRSLEQIVVGGPSWLGACAVMTTEQMDPQITQGAEKVALWMTQNGFAIGLPSGAVTHPQADRLKGIPLHAGRLVVLGDRVVVLSRS